ncbi:MAG: hypothetical protein A2Z99_08780 [Treponema sp. GWB1_62_6]|nr:MAG: hypothetical protein A2Z99_08780 [Treponema sp. GWB1_62_6]
MRKRSETEPLVMALCGTARTGSGGVAMALRGVTDGGATGRGAGDGGACGLAAGGMEGVRGAEIAGRPGAARPGRPGVARRMRCRGLAMAGWAGPSAIVGTARTDWADGADDGTDGVPSSRALRRVQARWR